MKRIKPLFLSANQRPEKKFLSRFVRGICQFAPLIGFVPSQDRQKGISFYMRVKDEASWIKASIASIESAADEIVVVDNGSTDGTFEILSKLENYNRDLIKLWRKPELDLCTLSNFALSQTNYSWAFRWDADMVAHTTGEFNIDRLRDRILSLDLRRFYIIYLMHINLAGDLFHQDPSEKIHIEEYVHSFSDQVKFIHPGRFEAVKFPKYYCPLFWYEPYSFHVNVMSSKKMLLRYYWEEWMEGKDYNRFPTLESYVASRIQNEFGTRSWDKAQAIVVRKVCKNFVRYNPQELSPYPELLKPHLENPKHRIVYKNGRIVERTEN